jgi:hypothetical protein
MLYTARLISAADSSISSLVRSRLTPMTGIHFSKEVAENPVSQNVKTIRYGLLIRRRLV